MLSDNNEHLNVLLKDGANINYQDREGRTPLFLTVKYNRVSMIKSLIQDGCDVNLGKFNQSNALHLAAKKGNTEVIELLIDAGHILDASNWGGNTPLLIACRFGHAQTVMKLISYGANVNICNKLGHYPLHYAAFAGNAGLVQILMDRGADSDVRTHLGINPIMLACERKHCNVVTTLASQCNLHYREQLYGGTVLHWAIASGCCHCVDCLLTHGASLTVADSTGRTPILEAVQSKQPEILRYLLDKHELVDFTCDPNNRLLHLAAFLGHTECVEIIAEHINTNHLIHEMDSFDESPLAMALKNGSRDTIQVLIRQGANISHIVILKPGSSPKPLSRSKHQPEGLHTETTTHMLSSNSIESGSSLDDQRSFGNAEVDNVSTMESPGIVSTTTISEEIPDTSLDITASMTCSDAPTANTSIGFSQSTKSTISVCTPLQMTPVESQSSVSQVVEEDVLLQQIQIENFDLVKEQLTDLCLESARELDMQNQHKVFKTYSAVKMGMIDMLRSASSQQMVAPVKFDFNTWLDNGPEAFVLKVTSLDLTNWIHQRMHTPWALRELCRGSMRRSLGYRASDKVEMLPIPATIKDFLNMKELEEIETSQIQIRSTGAFDDIDIE